MEGICKLCEKESHLQKSHLYPKFVVKWIKETSMNGYLRNQVDINRRQQDGPKYDWFCRDCEQILSQAEKRFSENVFKPYTTAVDSGKFSNIFPATLSGEYILRFVIGLQLRSVLAVDDFERLSQEQRAKISKFMSHWRKFLLGKSPKTGECESHILLLTTTKDVMVKGNTRDFPPNINRYLVRSLDNTILFSDDGEYLGVYTKLGPMAFYTSIIPRRVKGLENTKIAMKENTLTRPQIFGDECITNFIWFDRPLEVESVKGDISEKQSNVISDSMKKDPEKALNSLGFRMFQLDMEND